MNYLPRVSSDFLLNPGIIFLNHGSFGATPLPVFNSYQRWQREMETQPVEFLARRAPFLLQEARTILADFLGTSKENLAFITNATLGVNIVARSLNLTRGDEVLTSTHEYGALERTFQFLSEKQGFKIIRHEFTLPLSTAEDFIASLWKSITPKTRLIYLSHITSPTALIFPLEEICRRARQAGILTLIDGAHAPGQIPLFLDELGADFYTGNLHKWLSAPKGSAFLFARPSVQHYIEPLIVSWGWRPDQPTSSPFSEMIEFNGTRDISSFLAVPDAIQYQREHNWAEISRNCHELTDEMQSRIVRRFGIPPLTSGPHRWFAQMATAPLPKNIDLEKIKIRLYDDYHIEVPLIRWGNYNLIRFSFYLYNKKSDISALEKALEELIKI